MNTETTAKQRNAVLICTLPKTTLQALLMIARSPHGRDYLDCIHIQPSAGRLVAMNTEMMVWVRVRIDAVRTGFTLSGALCAQALAAAGTQESLEIRVTDVTQDARRRVSIGVAAQEFGEPENLATYPDPCAILAIRPDSEAVDFDPAALAQLRAAISLIVARKSEPLHVIARGSAPAIVVCRSPHVLGFLVRWEATECGDRWMKTTLREFGVDLSHCVPPTRERLRPVAHIDTVTVANVHSASAAGDEAA